MVGYVLEAASLVDVVGDGVRWDQVKSVTFGSWGSCFGGRAGGRHAGRVGVGRISHGYWLALALKWKVKCGTSEGDQFYDSIDTKTSCLLLLLYRTS